jgi:hypothetical protein
MGARISFETLDKRVDDSNEGSSSSLGSDVGSAVVKPG